MCGCKDCKQVTLFEGTPGVGIAATVVNPNGTLTFFYSDGSTFTTGVLTGAPGATGPMGPIGISPAGLAWQGAWVSGTSYDVNDTVSFGGASYFCYSATSGVTNPTIDTAHWALLAAQGAPGATGATGPAGTNGTNGITPSTAPVFFSRTASGLAAGIGSYSILASSTYTVPPATALANYEITYLVQAQLTFPTAGNQDVTLNLYKNGTAFSAIDAKKVGINGGLTAQIFYTPISFMTSNVNLVAGDVLTMRANASSIYATLSNAIMKVNKLT